MSMQENTKSMTQEDLDLALAKQLQESEYQNQNSQRNNVNGRDRCSVI